MLIAILVGVAALLISVILCYALILEGFNKIYIQTIVQAEELSKLRSSVNFLEIKFEKKLDSFSSSMSSDIESTAKRLLSLKNLIHSLSEEALSPYKIFPKIWYHVSENLSEYAYAKQGLESIDALEKEKSSFQGYGETYRDLDGTWRWSATLVHHNGEADWSSGNEPSKTEAMKIVEATVSQMVSYHKEVGYVSLLERTPKPQSEAM